MIERVDVRSFFARPKPLIGMVHLLPLPGAPRWRGSMQEVLDRAVSDASRIAAGGLDGIMIENYGDLPFTADHVEPSVTDAPLWIGSGLTAANAAAQLAIADGAIVGSAIQANGRAGNAIDPERVRRIADAAH